MDEDQGKKSDRIGVKLQVIFYQIVQKIEWEKRHKHQSPPQTVNVNQTDETLVNFGCVPV